MLKARAHARARPRLRRRRAAPRLLRDDFEQIVGLDVSARALEIAARRLKLDALPESSARASTLLHGSLTYRDKRLAGFDAAALVEVIEHLDPPRLAAFERIVFGFAQPGHGRRDDAERRVQRAVGVAAGRAVSPPRPPLRVDARAVRGVGARRRRRFGYAVRFLPVGPDDAEVGPPTQMAVFRR